jgi:hypothetical protein
MENRKDYKILMLIGVLLCISLIIGTSYAFFTATVTGAAKETAITSGTMSILYTDGPEVTLENAIPGSTVTKTFTVKNTGTVSTNYDVYLSEVINGFVDQTDLVYSLVSADGGYNTTSDVQMPNAPSKIVSSYAIAPSVTHSYTLTIKFLNKAEAQDDNQGKSFSAKLQVNEYKEAVTGTELASTLLTNAGGTAAIAAKASPDFSKDATTDEGMYAMADDYGTSYYYRGKIDNNNVLFGRYCWKVIRINGNGTTRMIYNGTPSNGQCTATGTATEINENAFNDNFDDNAYVGYMYGTAGSSTYDATHANTNSSTIKTAIDTWYNTNLSSYADKISDTEFCNDRSIASAAATWDSTDTALGYGTNITFYGAYDRIVKNNSPILTCPNKHDRFTVDDTTVGNGNLTYPVSLITADEATVAGGVYGTTNSSYYLYTGSWYWTVSANYFIGTYANGFNVGSDGDLDVNSVSDSGSGVRPVINLKTETLFTSGDGTSTNPFVIS